jgi:4-carboxymuconolactone decarboxylase
VNYYLRYEAGFSPRVREIAILTTARECDSQFEWAAHEPEALKEGIAPALIDIIRHRRPLAGVDPADATIIALGREMFGARKVSSDTYAAALKQFGRRALVDLVALMANYAGTAALLVAFDMQLDPGTRPGLPPLPR